MAQIAIQAVREILSLQRDSCPFSTRQSGAQDLLLMGLGAWVSDYHRHEEQGSNVDLTPLLGKHYIRLRLNLALNKFGRKEKNGSLIRVSMPAFGEDYKSASIMLTRFIEDLYPYLRKYL